VKLGTERGERVGCRKRLLQEKDWIAHEAWCGRRGETKEGEWSRQVRNSGLEGCLLGGGENVQ
jgi:hypothetical protein